MRWVYLAIVVVFLAAILIFIVQNRELVTMSFLGFGVRAPLAIMARGRLCARRDHRWQPLCLAAQIGAGIAAGRDTVEHVPGKACPGLDPGWPPVFRKGHATAQESENTDRFD